MRVDVYATKDGVPVQDLTAEDFEVSEDNTPQKVDSFEHIVVRTGGPQEERSEPASVDRRQRSSPPIRAAACSSSISTSSTSSYEGSHKIKEPLIDLMTRIMGPDDLVGVMTPVMSPSQITFGRRTKVIEDGLRTNWTWGRRESIILDERENLYSDRASRRRTATSTIPSQLAQADDQAAARADGARQPART